MLWSFCYFEICYFLFIISSVLLSERWWTLPKPFSVFMEKILWFLSLSLSLSLSVIKPWTLNYWFVYVDISLHLCADHDSSYSQCVFDFRLEEFYWNFYIYVHKKNWFVLCSHPHPLLPTWCVLITCRYQVSYDFITFDGKGYLSFFSGNFRCFDVRSSVNVFFH